MSMQYGIETAGNAPRKVIVWFDTEAERDAIAKQLPYFGLDCNKWVSHLPYRLSHITYDVAEIPGYRYKE